MTHKRKLIEVALPLEAINRESAREKSIRHGHPSTLHLWWARRPLAACRAVLFASLVDDPSAHPDRFPTEEAQEAERKRLFGVIEQLVRWENTTNHAVLDAARAEILASCDGNPPPILDPFCGGGSIPLEAQRLGLEAHASDLNPVAVLIAKALIEIPPRFAGRPPVHPREGMAKSVESWSGAQGLAADVRHYGAWIREQAQQRIGCLYPKAQVPKEQGGGEATVIAWLWARTVACPNPACGAQMPLIRSFALSTKKGKETWVEPVVDRAAKRVRFEIGTGKGKVPEAPKIGRGAKFRCLVCGQVAPDQHIKDEGAAGRMDAQLMAIVAEGKKGRVYLPPTADHEAVAESASPEWAPEEKLVHDPRAIWCVPYGLTRHRDLFTARQLVALTTFSDLVGEAREQVLQDATAAGMAGDGARLAAGGCGATAYADAIATYLAFGVSRVANRSSSICIWNTAGAKIEQTFGRQAIPMAWDFAEANPLAESTGSWSGSLEWIPRTLEVLPTTSTRASVRQLDATCAVDSGFHSAVATDPPYYDNIGYADLSDFFYVWLRRSLRGVWPDLFATLLTPKAEELVATPYRFGGDRRRAKAHFEGGLAGAFTRLREVQDPEYPITLFYAFKQTEDAGELAGVASTGWDTMLTALLDSGFAVVGTWPVRTERDQGLKTGTSVLASSIVLVCRPGREGAPLATRTELLGALRAELPEALRRLQHGSIAPVDLAQAAIGPGMAVFSRYARVVEADGRAMPVRSALGLINQVLDEVLAEQEGDFDAETRWAVAWFGQHGMNPGAYGEAEVLARAKDTATNALVEAGILESKGGKVRLLDRGEMPVDWDPTTDRRLTVWEITQHLVRALERGEQAAADLLGKVGGLGESARELAYRLYSICDRRGWSKEGLAYNGLIAAWPEIARLAAGPGGPVQPRLGV